jgi:hypothetical protein
VATDLNRLFDTLQSLKGTQGTASPAQAGVPQVNYAPSVTPKPTGGQSLFGDIAQGGINAVGGLLRAVTSVGRANTNFANDVVPYANKIHGLTQGGLQGEEVGQYLSAIWNGSWAGLGGFAKGLAYSFMPPTDQSARDLQGLFGGEKPVEGAYDMFQTKGYIEATKNLPWLAETRSEEQVGEIPNVIPFDIPLLGIEAGKGVPLTKAGLYSFGFDVGSDPFSWMTLGVGGALKGGAKGVGTVAKGQKIKSTAAKEKRPISLTELDTVTPPTLYKTAPTRSVPYNVLETNPLIYIGKEMGRGFVDAHRATANRIRSRRESRAAGKILAQDIARKLGERLSKGVENDADFSFSAILDEVKQEAYARLVKQAEGAKDVSPERSAELLGIQKGRLEALVPELIAKAEAKGLTRLDELRAKAEADGVTLRERIEADLMDDVARSFPGTSPAIARTQTAKYDAQQVEGLGGTIRAAADVEDADISTAWDEFRNTADDYTVGQALKRLLGELGSHEKGFKAKRAGGKTSAEEREMMKRLSAAIKQKEGGGSQLMAEQGKLRSVDKAALDNFASSLRKGLLGAGDTKEALDSLVKEASSLDGATLQQALASIPGGFRIAGERLQYMGVAGQVRATAEFNFIRSLRDSKYNPNTVEVGSTSLNDFTVVKGEGRVNATALSRVTKLSMQATGKWYPPELGDLLRKAGIKDNELFDGDAATNAENFIQIALWRKIEAKTAEARAEIFRAQYAQVQLAELLEQGKQAAPPELSDLQIAEISRRAAIYGKQSLALTDEEVGRMIELASDAKDAQIKAIKELTELGIDPFSQPGAIRTAILGSREAAARIRAEAQTRTGFAPTKELEEIKQVKKVINLVKQISNGEGAILQGSVLAERFTQAFFKALPKERTSKEVIKIGQELRDVIKNVEGLEIPRVRKAFFSQLANIVARAEAGSSRASVSGFDFAFTDATGKYVNSSVANQMAFMYAGSKTADSIDGGYFARYVDEVLLAGRTDLPEGGLGALKTHAQRAEILSSVSANWGGEGITFGLLQDALRAAKGGRASDDALSPAQKKTFAQIANQVSKKFEEDTVNILKETAVPKILFEERMQFRPGWIERLPAEEQKIAKAVFANKNRVYEIDAALAKEAKLSTNQVFYGQIADFLPGGKRAALAESTPAIRRIAEDVAARANAAARGEVELSRAWKLFDEVLPWWARKEELLKLSRAGSYERANGALQSTIMMANMLVRTEAAAKVADRAVATANKLADKTPESLKAEKAFFNGILNKLATKFVKEGYRTPAPADTVGKSLEEILDMENPLAFLAWVRNVRTGDVAGRADWDSAMQHLMNLETTGKGRAFKNARELFASYRGEADDAIRRATDREVIETIASLGNSVEPGKVAASYLNRKGIPQRRTILKLIDKAAPIFEKSEIERARGNSWIKEINLVAKGEVEAEIASLPDIEMTAAKAQELLATTLAELESLKLGWVPTLAMQSVGTSMRQFFLHRANYFVKTTTDDLDRLIDQYQLPDAKKAGFLKRSYEDLTNYTGFKGMVDTIRQMAPTAKRGKLTEDEWVMKMTRMTMSVRDMYLLSRGIVPVHTISLTRGEAIPNQLANAIGKNANEFNIKAVALTENDIMDALPDSEVVDLFFSSADGSPRFNMPITSVMPAARLLVAAMDSLKPGEYFNAEQLATLSRTMVDAMTLDAKKSSVSQGKKFSWVNLDPERSTRAIGVLTERMLEPDRAFLLYEKHIANSIYAHGILRYEAGQISEPIMDAWTRVATNPISSSSDRMKATVEAMEEINKILGLDEQGTELERMMAVLDMQARMAIEVDIDSLIDIQTANKITKAGFVPSPEAEKISKVQAASRKKAVQNEVTEALVEAMEAREPLLADMYAQKIAELQKAGYAPTPDEQHLLFNDIITDQAKIPWYISFTNTALRLFSFDYGKENVAPYLGGIARKAIEDQAEYTNVALQMSVKWDKVTTDTGINYMEKAFAGLQKVSDEDLPAAVLASDTIMRLVSRTQRGSVKPKEIKALKAASSEIEKFKSLRDSDGELIFPDEDPLLIEAIADFWRLSGHMFGPMGKVARAGIPAEWLNIQLRQVGASQVKGAFRQLDDGSLEFNVTEDGIGFAPGIIKPEDLAKQWRTWEITNPFLMASTLNSALARGEKLIQEAAYLQKQHGIKSPTKEQIKADGLIRIKGPQSLSAQGQELLYFMDTENYWYNSGIASQIITASRDLTGPYRVLEDVLEFASKFDELQNFAKRSMTIFRLGNFIMNFNGGVWANFLGGVTSPAAYLRSYRALKNLYPDLRDLPIELSKMEEQVVRYHARRAKEGYVLRPENDPVANKESMVVTAKGRAVTYKYSDLAEVYRQLGGETSVSSSRNLELLREAGDAEQFQKIGGQGMFRAAQRIYEGMSLKIGRWAAVRDDFIRMTMWLDELGKNNWSSFEVGAREALRKVDRYHPQVQDLSPFNAKVTRQFVMFFVWQAKTLGWVVSDILDNPGKITALLRAQYALQTQDDNQPEYFGSFDPKGEFLRSWQQGQMNYLTGNLGYSFSYANPVNDLLGSNGWLSKINYKTYESPTTNALTSSMGTVENFLYSSNPIFANLVIAWLSGRTVGGQDLLRNGTFSEESLQVLTQEVAGQLGLTLPHAALALAFPEQFSRSNWTDETTMDEKQKDTLRYAFNWLTGMRSTEFLGVEQQQKAISEIRSTLDRVVRERRED